MKSDDLISRQMAIDAIEQLDLPEDMCMFEILSHIELALGTLPSAPPEINCSEIPNNSDLITSAQPERKTWRWIGIDDEPCDVYECEQCGTTYDTVDRTWDLPKYCPNCGAKMLEDGEG